MDESYLNSQLPGWDELDTRAQSELRAVVAAHKGMFSSLNPFFPPQLTGSDQSLSLSITNHI